MFPPMSVDASVCGSRLIAEALMEDLYRRGLISSACEGVSAVSDVSEEVPGVDHSRSVDQNHSSVLVMFHPTSGTKLKTCQSCQAVAVKLQSSSWSL